MKAAFIATTLLTIASSLVSAAPVEDVKRDLHIRRQYGTATSSYAPYPTGTGAPYPYPSGTAPTGPAPTGTAPSVPYPTGGATCAVDGKLYCNGLYQFGLCNWGHIIWQPVADGTACINGEITYAPGYLPTSSA